LQRVLERSKEILNDVNAAVKDAADCHRLNDIQRRLDKGPFDKIDHLSANEFKVHTDQKTCYLTLRITNRVPKLNYLAFSMLCNLKMCPDKNYKFI
jgi:hypothetical protein